MYSSCPPLCLTLAAIVEVNSETDFVARNELFQGLVLKLAHAAMNLPANPSGQPRELELQKVGLQQCKSSGSTRGCGGGSEQAWQMPCSRGDKHACAAWPCTCSKQLCGEMGAGGCAA